MRQRQIILPKAKGDVLEIGCGGGTNFHLYDYERVHKLYALEPSQGMLKRARLRAESLNLAGDIEFLQEGAEAISLEDRSIDSAVLTFSLCTIPDWQSALAEIRRVLKPDGRLYFCEHGLSPELHIAKWQNRIEPIWKPLAGGCHLTRDIQSLISLSGFHFEQSESRYLPKTPKFAGYVSWGSARPL